jgi:hypothetical protein
MFDQIDQYSKLCSEWNFGPWLDNLVTQFTRIYICYICFKWWPQGPQGAPPGTMPHLTGAAPPYCPWAPSGCRAFRRVRNSRRSKEHKGEFKQRSLEKWDIMRYNGDICILYLSYKYTAWWYARRWRSSSHIYFKPQSMVICQIWIVCVKYVLSDRYVDLCLREICSDLLGMGKKSLDIL